MDSIAQGLQAHLQALLGLCKALLELLLRRLQLARALLCSRKLLLQLHHLRRTSA